MTPNEQKLATLDKACEEAYLKAQAALAAQSPEAKAKRAAAEAAVEAADVVFAQKEAELDALHDQLETEMEVFDDALDALRLPEERAFEDAQDAFHEESQRQSWEQDESAT